MGIKRLIILLVTLLAAAAHTSYAYQIFSNRGTLGGWTAGTRAEHNGKVEQVNTASPWSPTSLRMTQVYDYSPSYKNGRYHSEARVASGYRYGDTRYYGFAFRLAPNWQFTEQSYTLAQFIGNFNGQCGEGYMPSTMIWIVGNRLYTRRKWGSVCDQHSTTITTSVTVEPGKWHRIVIQALWTNDNGGFLKMWYNDKQVVDRPNVPTTVKEAGPAFEFRVGLYANGWHDDHPMKGNQATRQVWYSKIAIGTTMGDVDPKLW
ncbi:polysaccharide lyase [Podospora didyma]|uniref:Polysaccharide lyase n=1 Tax=Podospora didyma TaxID=330526 RepID=A0AAE0P880_9PEZI|nr:polysaccharide lyase [Podospora didyma]